MTKVMGSFGIPFRLPPLSQGEEEEEEARAAADLNSAESVEDDSGTYTSSPEPATSAAGASGSPDVKSTRTRVVKSRTVFAPEDDRVKKPRGRNGGRPSGAGGAGATRGKGRGRGRGRGRPPRGGRERSALQDLLKDEEADGGCGGSDGHRKRSRNASDGENRWDRIRAKFKVLLQKMRMDTHFLEVYQQDGWRSSGREKLKPTAELKKAEGRVRGIKAELREVAKRLTEMNPGGSRWGGIQEDGEGNIEVDEIMCTKCGRGDSDDSDDILLCDFAGCFRAYHQNCLSPPIKPEAFPEEEEDWFCWQCECLTDCLDLLEREFQGRKFTSWEDVFPDMETKEKTEGIPHSAEPPGGLLETDSDDSDDESFKESSSSSSESEDEDAADRRRARRANSGSGSDSSGGGGGSGKEDGSSSSGGGSGSDDSHDDDSEADWMSDAESVGSDEVSKLRSEAGDLAFLDEAGGVEEASPACGGRSGRASARRVKRNAALGLGHDHAAQTQREKREIVEVLAGNPVDPNNIIESRTRRKKSVDYVKLNQTVFGDNAVDGDQLSSEAENESSEASEGEVGASPPPSPRTKRKPQIRSPPVVDPATGQPRKRGRPRKAIDPIKSIDPTAGEKRKRGRPRKVTEGGAAAAGKPADATKSVDPTRDPTTGEKRKRGRPRKVTEGGAAAAGKPADATKSVDPTSSRDHTTGEKRKRGRPRKVVESWAAAAGGGSSAKKRKVGRPRKPENDAVKRDPGAGTGGSSPAPRSPRGATQVDSGGRYQTKNGKGPGRRPEEAFVVESDTDQEEEGEGQGDEADSTTDQDEEVVGRLPASIYEDLEDDTAEVAAVAAAVAARAAQEAAPA